MDGAPSRRPGAYGVGAGGCAACHARSRPPRQSDARSGTLRSEPHRAPGHHLARLCKELLHAAPEVYRPRLFAGKQSVSLDRNRGSRSHRIQPHRRPNSHDPPTSTRRQALGDRPLRGLPLPPEYRTDAATRRPISGPRALLPPGLSLWHRCFRDRDAP